MVDTIKTSSCKVCITQNKMTRYSVLLLLVSQELYGLTNTFETRTLHVLTFHISFEWKILRKEKERSLHPHKSSSLVQFSNKLI